MTIESLIESLTEAMIAKEATVDGLGSMLGQQIEKYTNNGYEFLPSAPQFSTAWLGIWMDPERGELLNYLSLTLSPDALMSIEELSRLFGPWDRIPANPGGKSIVIAYRYMKPDWPIKVMIFASLTGDPKDPKTRIHKITIRREEWRIDK